MEGREQVVSGRSVAVAFLLLGLTRFKSYP
jgi:hypothetical protein